jgi:hypothetical protein
MQVKGHATNTPSIQVQVQLYSRLVTEFSIEPILGTGSMFLRDLVDTDQLLFIVREYYNLEGEKGEEEREELHKYLRPYLLLILKAYFTNVCVCVCIEFYRHLLALFPGTRPSPLTTPTWKVK